MDTVSRGLLGLADWAIFEALRFFGDVLGVLVGHGSLAGEVLKMSLISYDVI